MNRKIGRSATAVSGRARRWALGLALLLPACGGPPADALPQVEVVPLHVQPVAWNLANQNVGQVAAVAELYEDTVVFGDQGAQIFTGGLVLATDTSARQWKTAAVIPAGDLSGQWLVAVDGAGRLLRLRDRRNLEDIADRYGLVGASVAAVATLGPEQVAFALPGDLAVADGKTVTRYPVTLSTLVGGGGRAAGLSDGGIRVFEPSASPPTETAPAGPQTHDFLVPEAVAVTFDANAKLVVASRSALYAENGSGGLDKIYTATEVSLHGLVTSGTTVWVAIGDTLAELAGSQLRQSASGTIPSDAELVGSASGDVWVRQAGTLSRFGKESSAAADLVLWQKTVLPMFTRLCSLCHLPGGSASIDLSTYASWSTRRALINQRVLVGKPSPMPPAGAGKLTADEQAALKTWLASQ